MSSEELVNIATNVDTYLRYLATPGQTRFVAPSRKLGGAPYPLEADLIVHVDGVPTNIPWTYDANSSEIVFSNGLMSGALVEIWRRTEVDESLVTFSTATKWTPKDNNKSVTQLLMLIQELWGGLSELSIALTNHVNAAIASVFKFSGTVGAIWSTSVSAGDTSITTPYKFTTGILMVGGSMYNLSDPTHVTLDNSGDYTIINFSSAFVVSHEAILIIF